MPDINRDVSIEQVDYTIDVNNIEYSIEINPQQTFELQLNEQGPQGLTGQQGPQGPQGIQGETGENGADGFSPIATVSKVGDTATISITDINGTTTATITDGTDGINGQDGQAATITVGTVTTGLPTDPASVTNVGTSGAAVFDFAIPKGDTGSTGATGNGIASITKTGTVGLVDTYTVLYTDGTSTTFTVTNGQNGTGSVADVLVNGTSVLDGQDAKILIKTINSNSITGSGNLNVGTVTSVNNIAPISGDVTLTANDVDALPDSTKYGADLSYSSNTLQILDQDGNSLGSPVTIQSSPDIDNKSITTNLSDELQTVGVIDKNNTSNAIKTWTGTKAQYDAIVTKDGNTLYNITDDTDVTLTLLNALYPIGSIYIGTMNACPLATLGVGTWQLVASDRVLQGATDGSVVGTTKEAGLPNITGSVNGAMSGQGTFRSGTGAITLSTGPEQYGIGRQAAESTSNNYERADFDASLSNPIYGNSTTVQPPAYLVNIWERIS